MQNTKINKEKSVMFVNTDNKLPEKEIKLLIKMDV